MLPNLEELRLWIRQSGETNVDLGATNVSWRWWAKKILKLTVAKLLNAKHRIRYRKVL